MGKPSIAKRAPPSNSFTSPESHNDDDELLWIYRTRKFFEKSGIDRKLPEGSRKKDSFSDLIRSSLKVNLIEQGRIICHFTVKPPVVNVYDSLHGGVVAAVAEFVALACARTVVGEGTELFLGEFAISYLSAAVVNMELEVEGCIVRRGRNVTVTSVEFKVKETRKMIYTARATFYCLPVAKL